MPKRIKTLPAKNTKEELITQVYNTKGEVVEKIALPKEIFGVKVNPALLAQAVRVYLTNRRSGNVATKTRSQVIGSTRKIYRQKGTGRARHGDIKAPIFVGGGIAHGPHPKDYSLRMPTKMRRLALFSALSDKWHEDRIKIVTGFEQIMPKTKKIVEIISNLKFTNGEKKTPKTLLVLDRNIKNVVLAGRNLPYLTIKESNLLNAYEILANNYLLFTKDSIGKLRDTFLGKKEEKKAQVDIKQEFDSQVKIKKIGKERKTVTKLVNKKKSKTKRQVLPKVTKGKLNSRKK